MGKVLNVAALVSIAHVRPFIWHVLNVPSLSTSRNEAKVQRRARHNSCQYEFCWCSEDVGNVMAMVIRQWEIPYQCQRATVPRELSLNSSTRIVRITVFWVWIRCSAPYLEHLPRGAISEAFPLVTRSPDVFASRQSLVICNLVWSGCKLVV